MIDVKAYLDNAATTGVSKEVFKAMEPYFKKQYGNPSSLHEKGIKNRKVINTSKRKIAELLNCNSKEVHFTSCGTESINWAIKGLALANRTKNEIITTKTEHHATLHTCEFMEKNGYIVHYLDVDEFGFVDLNQLNTLINDNTLLVSILMANNEIGTIQNVEEIRAICDSASTYLHLDAVQVLTHLKLDLTELGADLVSFSGHKFHAPKGIGMLYIKKGTKIENLLHGGQQENSLRSGTENVAFIVGFTQALEDGIKQLESNKERLNEYSRYFLDKLKRSSVPFRLNGPKLGENRLPGNINISFKDLDGSDITYYLNKENIYVSTGSACDSTSIEPSHVLKAINVPNDYIDASIRFSIGDDTKFEEVEYAVDKLINIVNNLKE